MASQPPRIQRLSSHPAPSEVLALIRGELVDLGRRAEDLQTTISMIVARSPAPFEPAAQIRLQAADALCQRLERLAQLVGALEGQVSEGCALGDSTSAGDLARAVARLGGRSLASVAMAPDDDGECEFF